LTPDCLRCGVSGRWRAIPPDQLEIAMNEKSHVSMEQRVCLACGVRFDTGSLLLDRRLRASLERYTATGWGLCGEHQKLADDGFVALVECDPKRSGLSSHGGHIKPEQAYRTGRLAHLKREVFARVQCCDRARTILRFRRARRNREVADDGAGVYRLIQR
jgi:hypothetical protein